MNWRIVLAVLLTVMFYGNFNDPEQGMWDWRIRLYGALLPFAWGWALA